MPPSQGSRPGRVPPRGKPSRYLLFHKPYGVLCQFTDALGRPCLKDYVPIGGVYASGRLDWDSEGLLLLTDDGPLIHRLSSPSSKLEKIYWVQVEEVPGPEALERLRNGVMIEGRLTLPAGAEPLPGGDTIPPRVPPIRERRNIPTSWLEIRLMEGRNRQVRRMTAAVGHPTLRLIRRAIGPFTLEGLPEGAWRELSPSEVRALLPFGLAGARPGRS
ncbi:MAG TPA: pseudouridine synthase [Fibrobacteria bacterium]|nr:pseudouridine synthase [Fibrobacteria bacterium]